MSVFFVLHTSYDSRSRRRPRQLFLLLFYPPAALRCQARTPVMLRSSLPLMLLIIKLRQVKALRESHSFRQRLTVGGSRRRDRLIPRLALQVSGLSPFVYLYGPGKDQSLITLTGFDHRAFRYILTSFAPVYDAYTPYSDNGSIRRQPPNLCGRGRTRSMNATQCLAFVLT